MIRPLMISILMLLVFVLLQKISLDFMFTLIIAICTYGLFVSYLGIRAFSGFHFLWIKLLRV